MTNSSLVSFVNALLVVSRLCSWKKGFPRPTNHCPTVFPLLLLLDFELCFAASLFQTHEASFLSVFMLSLMKITLYLKQLSLDNVCFVNKDP